MKFLFLHRNFPAQFKHMALALAKDKKNEVVFVTNNTETKSFGGIKKYSYKLKRKVPNNCHRYLRFYEESIIHGQSAAELLISLKQQGFKPDVIFGHSWGSSLFVKEIFPDVPYIAHIEWYYNPENSDVDFGGKVLDVDERASLKTKNSHILQDLVSCDWGVSPTQWQKSQVPEIFRDKIKVMHEGIDTDFCKPNDNVEFKVPNTDIVLTRKDEVVTYATRGMEEYRGFPEFMKAASELLKQRPNLHILVGGEDRVCYGKHLKDDTFKKKMLRELEFDESRLHFVGPLPYNEYVKLLQVSSAHVYLTYPFVLSWSFLEAMAAGCPIVASDTAPVTEVMQDKFSGLLVDFYDIDGIVAKVNELIDHKEKYQLLRENARDVIVKNYDLKMLLPKQIEFLKSVANKTAK
ncbi:glycosyltransferase family 4 protein [bacterium]|nr:glycosyltransferase family 4 protein [bacterium]